jgi:hypothetical protein
MADTTASRRLEGKLLEECAEWIWEQLQEDGIIIAGELIELVLQMERELAIQHKGPGEIAPVLADEFKVRRTPGVPENFNAPMINVVLEWEEEWLGFAGIPRAQS